MKYINEVLKNCIFKFLFISLLVSSAFAYSGGQGESYNPYRIASVSDWRQLMNNPLDWDSYFIMTADVNLQGVLVTPVGTDYDLSFTGVFNGDGHIISNVYINNPTNHYIGLFGAIGSEGRVLNLGVENVNITGNQNVGGLAGINWSWPYSSIINCYVTGTVSGNRKVGGLTGENSGIINDCYAACAVNGNDYIGGFTGLNTGTISGCYATGAVSGNNYAGGLAGTNTSAGTITDSYAAGTVTGNSYIGGLAGENTYAAINASYSIGRVTGNSDAGGLAGYSYNGITAASFWDVNTSGQRTSAGGAGKTTAEMQNKNTFLNAGWDFAGETANGTEDLWQICCGREYPQFSRQFGQPCTVYSGGSGTGADPYKIAAVCDWKQLMANSSDWGSYFIMTADINLQGIALEPVGEPILRQGGNFIPFYGVFNGNGHIIRNARINKPGYSNVGLFGSVVDGQIRNLGCVDVNVTGMYFVGGLAGYCSNSTIDNCYSAGEVNGVQGIGGLAGVNGGNITGCYSAGTVNGSYDAGGLIGWNDGNAIACYSTAKVNGMEQIGGLIGVNIGFVGNCYAAGDVNGDFAVGGLAGLSFPDGGVFENCYAKGNVNGNIQIGGLIGENQSPVNRCYSSGIVSGNLQVGGLAGMNYGGNISDSYSTSDVAAENKIAGGLAGYNFYGSISNCYSVGAVSGGSNAGGLIGYNKDGNVTASFWNVNTSGQTASAGGAGKTTTEMQNKNTFLNAGWDFITPVWKICQGTNYPKLEWQIPASIDFVCPDGVGFEDLAYFLSYWLSTNCGANNNCNGTDMNVNGTVNFLDFVVFADNWMKEE